MKFISKRSDLLKAIQSLRVQAARHDLLLYISDVLIQAVQPDKIELSAADVLGDMKFTVDASVVNSGSVSLPIKRFAEILHGVKAETAEFTVAPSGQVQIVLGERIYHLEGISSGTFIPSTIVDDMASSRQKRRKMTASLLVSVSLHLVLAVILAMTIKNQVLEKDAIYVEWVEPPPPSMHRVKKPLVARVQPKVTLTQSLRPSDQPKLLVTTPKQVAQTARQSLAQIQHNVDFSEKVPNAITAPITTTAKVPPAPGDLAVRAPAASQRNVESGEGTLTGRFRAPTLETSRSSAMTSLVESTNAVDSADLSDARFTNLIMVPENTLGAVLVGEGADVQGHIRLIRLKHSLSDWWQDPTAIPSFMKWLEEHTRFRADMNFSGGALAITDPRILDAPLLIMTGHDKDITVGRNLVKGGPLTDSFSPEERAGLRKYIVERGGTLFFDDCGFHGLFAAQVADELQRIFPEYPLENIPHSHEIYRIYYQLSIPPTGGDVFWGSENNPKASKFKYQKGITIGRRLAVIYNRKDYMCAMETAEIPSRTMLRLRRSTDVHRFMTNLLFYTMKYGGNTDRSDYKP